MDLTTKHNSVLMVYTNLSKGLGIPYGFSCICSIAQKYCEKVVLFDTTFIDNNKIEIEFEKTINELKPSLICFSVNEFSWEYDNVLINLAKNIIDTTVIVGGIYVTAAHEMVSLNKNIDIMFLGESDFSFNKFLSEPCISLNDIPSICYKDKNGTLIYTTVSLPTFSNIDYPLPAFALFAEQHIIRPYPSSKPIRRVGVVETSRGCPYSCTYCCNSVLHNLYANCKPYHRDKNITQVISEIKLQIQLFNINYVNFLDDTMLLNPARLQVLMNEYKKIINLPFFICTRPETVDDYLLQLLKDAGAHCIALGVECGSEIYRRTYLKRDISNQTLEDKFKLISSYGIRTMSTNMIGLPFETIEDVQSTLSFNALLKVDYVGLSIFYPFIGTPLGKLSYINKLVANNIPHPYSFRERTILNQPQLPPAFINNFYKLFHIKLDELRKKSGYGATTNINN